MKITDHNKYLSKILTTEDVLSFINCIDSYTINKLKGASNIFINDVWFEKDKYNKNMINVFIVFQADIIDNKKSETSSILPQFVFTSKRSKDFSCRSSQIENNQYYIRSRNAKLLIKKDIKIEVI